MCQRRAAGRLGAGRRQGTAQASRVGEESYFAFKKSYGGCDESRLQDSRTHTAACLEQLLPAHSYVLRVRAQAQAVAAARVPCTAFITWPSHEGRACHCGVPALDQSCIRNSSALQGLLSKACSSWRPQHCGSSRQCSIHCSGQQACIVKLKYLNQHAPTCFADRYVRMQHAGITRHVQRSAGYA